MGILFRTMIKVGGRNEYKQLGENSNATDYDGEQIICPAINSHLDITSLLSFSIYSSHLVWVTKNKRAYAVGFNSCNKISSTIPTGKLERETEIKILGNNSQQCSFLSAVCGTYYTLYLISQSIKSKIPSLAYVYQGEDNGNPLFLNIGDSIPIALYGGRSTCATINNDGSILILTENIFRSPSTLIRPSILPNSEKAVYIGCCDDYVIALSSNGHVYESKNINNRRNPPTFSMVSELRNYTVIDISGAYRHCFAVTNDGHVFARGANDFGQLAVGKDVKNSDKFIEVTSLNGKKIVQASAGRFHSLFLTIDGKMFGCGRNTSGSLFLKTGNSTNSYFLPVESSITGASYCFAGNSLSIVIIGPNIPPNIPNRRINQSINSDANLERTPVNQLSDLRKIIQLKDQEIANLKKQNKLQKMKINEIQLKDQEIANLKNQNKLQKMKINEIQLKDQEIAKLEQKNKLQMKKINDLQTKIDKSRSSSSLLQKQSPHQSKGLNIIDVNELDKIKKVGKIGRGAMAKVVKVAREEYYAMKIINIELCQKDDYKN